MTPANIIFGMISDTEKTAPVVSVIALGINSTGNNREKLRAIYLYIWDRM